MKIALAQIDPTVGDFSNNRHKILEFAGRAQQLGADLVLFPELAVCGYPPADLLEKSEFVERASQVLDELCAWTAQEGRPAVLCGGVLPVASPGEGKQVRNVAVLMAAGKVISVQQKMLLPFYDVFDEQRYFEPAATQSVTQVPTSAGSFTVAVTICEDAWNDKGFWPRRRYSVDPVEHLMQTWPQDRGPRVILNLSASPFWQGKRRVRREMLGALAKRHHAWVMMVNQVGGNDSLVFDGSSIALRPDGTVAAEAACFEEDLVLVESRPSVDHH